MMSHDQHPKKPQVQFGDYLVAVGAITAEELEAALSLQRDQNPRLGRLAHMQKLLTFDDICCIHQHQRRMGVPFGTAAIELGLLSEDEVERLLDQQAAVHVRLGQVLVENNRLTLSELEQHLEEYHQKYGLPMPRVVCGADED